MYTATVKNEPIKTPGRLLSVSRPFLGVFVGWGVGGGGGGC